MHNIKRQKIDLMKVRHLVLSHDDWDHIAGLGDVLDRNQDLTVYVVPHFKQQIKDRIRAMGVRLVEAPGPVMVTEGVYTTGELAGVSGRGVLYEQALVIKDGVRLGVITGCAHPRLPDILQAVREHFHQDIDLVAGGFHLKDTDPARIKEIAEGLVKFGVVRVAPLHCTGAHAVKEFKRFYADNHICLREGDVLEV